MRARRKNVRRRSTISLQKQRGTVVDLAISVVVGGVQKSERRRGILGEKRERSSKRSNDRREGKEEPEPLAANRFRSVVAKKKLKREEGTMIRIYRAGEDPTREGGSLR